MTHTSERAGVERCRGRHHAATPCNTMQHTAIRSNTLQHTATQSHMTHTSERARDQNTEDDIMLQYTATRWNTLQHIGAHSTTRCNTLQHTVTNRRMTHTSERAGVERCTGRHHTATPCNMMQHTATRWKTLQHTATHCHTLTRDAFIRKSRSWKMQRTTSCSNALLRRIEVSLVTHTWVMSESQMSTSHERMGHVTRTSVMSHIHEWFRSREWVRVTNEWFAPTHWSKSFVWVVNECRAITEVNRVIRTRIMSEYEYRMSSNHERVLCFIAYFRAIIEVNCVMRTRVMSEYEYRMSSSHERVLCFIAYFRAIIEVRRVPRTRVMSEVWIHLSHERVSHVTHTSVMSHIYESCLSLEWLRATNECFTPTQSSRLT